MTAEVIHGDCLDVMRGMADASVDAIVTDPPYGLEFMGKDWDKFNPDAPRTASERGDHMNGGAWKGTGYDGKRRPISPARKHPKNEKCGKCGKWRVSSNRCTCSNPEWEHRERREAPPQMLAFETSMLAWAEEALRVAKPGAHLIAFGGTRTHHRLMCAIEDAGWEIRDCLMWLYGSGFPKSLDVSKAMDKVNGETDRLHRFTAWMRTTGLTSRQLDAVTNTAMGGHYLTAKSQPAIPTPELWALIRPLVTEVPAWVDELVQRVAAEREVIGEHPSPATSIYGTDTDRDVLPLTAPATDLARQWQGWGTALKPAWESIIVARKPYDLTQLCAILARTIQGAICQLPSLARDAGWSSPSSLSACVGDADSALWRAVERCSTPDDLYALMATSPSEWATISSLSIAWSWLDTLAALSEHASTFTTEMASSLTTDLRILNSSPSRITPATIIEAVTDPHGIGSSASLAVSILSAARMKLLHTLGCFAAAPATSSDEGLGLRPDYRTIILARKPLAGTVAANVAEHGTGGLNIDGCRIAGPPSQGGARRGDFLGIMNDDGYVPKEGHIDRSMAAGRWPANVCLDEDAAALLDAQSGERGGGFGKRGGERSLAYGFGGTMETVGYGDTGGASRFFYCAKASRREREAGLGGAATERRSTSYGSMRSRECNVCGSRAKEPGPNARWPNCEHDDWRWVEQLEEGVKGGNVRNGHPCVKPLALMRWLCRLVTPPGGTILDPFAGSGTTGCAAVLEGFGFVGIEREAEYVEIARRRIAHWVATVQPELVA